MDEMLLTFNYFPHFNSVCSVVISMVIKPGKSS